MKTYPINLIDLVNRRVVVIGGGNVAERKIGGLIEAGAHVHVISPQVSPEIEAWVKAGRLTWQARPYQSGDLAGAFIVFSATDDGAVNQAAWQEAQSTGCLI
ncbi:MAG TPA: bifunctional precorrin-2 dehydrogenase/sirohydrochlorin ferrochelatase, partial [Anaerolineales bacterium]|nr:bifunctional precorrin-2 dehydrogenase/sirohydrochlorin ferrochelatase [Anaerolineales bacterium]